MTVEFLEEADDELTDAALWHESKQPGLGRRFRDEIAHVVNRIFEDPMLWREREGGYRRVNCPVFPYFVAYIMRDQRIISATAGQDIASRATENHAWNNITVIILFYVQCLPIARAWVRLWVRIFIAARKKSGI